MRTERLSVRMDTEHETRVHWSSVILGANELMMKNITLSADQTLIEAARRTMASQPTLAETGTAIATLVSGLRQGVGT